MYCSNKCKAKNELHHTLCGGNPDEIGMLFEAAMRICMDGSKDLKSNICFIPVDRLETDETIFDFKTLDNEANLKSFASLKFDRDRTEIYKEYAAIVHKIQGEAFCSITDKIYDTICHVMSLLKSNCYSVASLGNGKSGTSIDIEVLGFGVCLFGSLLRHSCNPNVFGTSYNDKIVFYITRPVKAGEQLTTCYDKDFSMENRKNRRLSLKGFGINCKCEACEKDWPVLMKLPRKVKDFQMPSISPDSFIDVKSEIKDFKKNCKYLEKIWKFHPCMETAFMSTLNVFPMFKISQQRL